MATVVTFSSHKMDRRFRDSKSRTATCNTPMARNKRKTPPPATSLSTPSAQGKDSTELSSPADRWFSFLDQIGLKRAALSLTVLFALYVRWAVALNPYSGAAAPPMYGDYEAQRHWMELTLHVPLSQWYTYDLEWWGLDYPPLTAYVSWLCGLVGSWINPDWFALDNSRGYESPDAKFYMRATVIVSECLVYIPAVISFANKWFDDNATAKKNTAILLMLLQPALLIVDHGHFQYNAVMLGFTLLAINNFLSASYAIGGVFFCLSLGFKQMALYYAPAVFAYLLGKCFQEPNGISLFIRLGVSVIATFSALLLPWLTSLDAILQVVHRVFPLARGLYEDKVANIWCAASVVIKLKQLLDVQTCMRLSLAATLLAILPSCIHLGFNPTRTRLLYTLVNTSLAFFLFSFQVHEKSILLPVLPVTLLVLDEPHMASWFVNVAMFSMFPLLKRDKLVLPYFLLVVLWNWAGNFSQKNAPTLIKYLSWASYATMAVWHALEYSIPAPARYPDLYTVFNVLLSAAGFMAFLTYFNYRQLVEVMETREGKTQKKKKN